MNDKTEYLFESDEEKAIIKKVILEEEKKSKKNKKLLIITINVVFVVALSLGAFFTSKYMINYKISKMISSDTNSIPGERMNKYSNSLKQISQNNDIDKYEVLINKANPIG